MVGVVLLPGLLAAGIGTLIFVGLDSLTGLGAVSLAIPDLPAFARPDDFKLHTRERRVLQHQAA